MKRIFIGLAWVGLLFLMMAGSSYATAIVIQPGAALAGDANALAALNRAAGNWGSLFSDPITVTINANLALLGPGILGSTTSKFLQGGYDLIRDQMVADAADEADNTILASLPTASQVSAYVPAGYGLESFIVATKANLKALGFEGLDGLFGLTDASIAFSSTFGFDFNNSDGVGAGLYDFETVATHEIGHVLGFVSGVDEVDSLMGQILSGNAFFEPLDLFRFGPEDPRIDTFTDTPRSLLPGSSSFFDDGSNEWAFSTGYYTGDGREASHWKDDSLTGTQIGIMDPTLASGTVMPISAADLRALDLIGWDLRPSNPVPEPSTLMLLGTGLIGVITGVRCRQKR